MHNKLKNYFVKLYKTQKGESYSSNPLCCKDLKLYLDLKEQLTNFEKKEVKFALVRVWHQEASNFQTVSFVTQWWATFFQQGCTDRKKYQSCRMCYWHFNFKPTSITLLTGGKHTLCFI